MRRAPGLNVCLVLMFFNGAQVANDTERFDGIWNTTVSCSTTLGALGYIYQFPSTVKNGVLHGEEGILGKPGWLQLTGQIRPDGTARIHAKGLVGKQKAAIGSLPPGTPYNYRIVGKFSDKEGTGRRVEERSCKVTFVKNQ